MSTNAVPSSVVIPTAPDVAAVRARWAVSVAFVMNGLAFASWVANIPAVRHGLELSDGALGSALFAMAAGAMASFPLAGRGTQLLGARKLTLATGLGICLMLPQPLLVGVYPSLLIVLFVLGAMNGAMDVAMNALAVKTQNQWGRPIMSSFHGLWSVGGLAGAMGGSAAARAGLPPAAHLLLVAGLCAASLLLVMRWLPGPEGVDETPRADAKSTRDATGAQERRWAMFLGLGGIIFCSFMIEGAMADWSAVYLRDIVGTDASQAALGYAAFSLTMTGMRLLGDHLTQRWGAMRLLRGLNAAGAAALALALVVGDYGITLVAFAFTGLGVATVAPTVFSAAARRAGSAGAGRGIATVAVYGYTGFLAGPPLIGWLAQVTSLPSALAVLALLAFVIVVLSAQLREDADHPAH